MNEIMELVNILDQKSVSEIEQIRDEYIAENGDSKNHIIQRICGAIVQKKKEAIA